MTRPLALVLLLVTAPSFAREPDRERPNVLLILTDDQGWGDIHSHGNKKLDTPNLDRLAEQGARFDRFFVSPVCAPTRAAMLTGRYPLRGGVHGVTRARETLRSEEVTIAEVLGGAGYATGCFGKWHNGAHWPEDPHGQGFDEFAGFTLGHLNNYFDPLLQHPPEHAPTRPEPALPDGPARVEGYVADVFTDAALRFIGAKKGTPDPWFCYLPLNTPHSPFQAPAELYEKYRARGFDEKNAAAYAMVENVDRNVGRLLASLEAWDLEEDTVVLFLTDNGPNTARYNGGMRGRKGSPHEGGVRVPLFVRWPGRIGPGTVVTRNAMHVDLLPTLCDLCDVPLPEGVKLDGKSVAPLLTGDPTGEASDWPDRTLFTWTRWNGDVPQPKNGAVRTDRWRAVNGWKGWQLYDMTADPGQTTDVADRFPEVRDELARAYREKWEEVTADGFEPVPVTVSRDHGVIELPAHEASLRGDGASFVGKSGWANDWITNWTDLYTWVQWPIRVTEPGMYQVSILYAATEEQAGNDFRLIISDAPDGEDLDGGNVGLIVALPPHAAPTFPSPDLSPRGEVYERPWAEFVLGRLSLSTEAKNVLLDVEADVKGSMPEVKAVRLTPVAE